MQVSALRARLTWAEEAPAGLIYVADNVCTGPKETARSLRLEPRVA